MVFRIADGVGLTLFEDYAAHQGWQRLDLKETRH